LPFCRCYERKIDPLDALPYRYGTVVFRLRQQYMNYYRRYSKYIWSQPKRGKQISAGAPSPISFNGVDEGYLSVYEYIYFNHNRSVLSWTELFSIFGRALNRNLLSGGWSLAKIRKEKIYVAT